MHFANGVKYTTVPTPFGTNQNGLKYHQESKQVVLSRTAKKYSDFLKISGFPRHRPFCPLVVVEQRSGFVFAAFDPT